MRRGKATTLVFRALAPPAWPRAGMTQRSTALPRRRGQGARRQADRQRLLQRLFFLFIEQHRLRPNDPPSQVQVSRGGDQEEIRTAAVLTVWRGRQSAHETVRDRAGGRPGLRRCDCMFRVRTALTRGRSGTRKHQGLFTPSGTSYTRTCAWRPRPSSGDQVVLPTCESAAVIRGRSQAPELNVCHCPVQVTPPRHPEVCRTGQEEERTGFHSAEPSEDNEGGGRRLRLSSSAETLRTGKRPASWFLRCSCAC